MLAVTVAVAVGRISSVGVFVGTAVGGIAAVAVADAATAVALAVTVALAVWKGPAVSDGS
jgi:hypothetical protein